MQKTYRNAISFMLKCLTVIFSLGGVLLSFLTAKQEGYFPWYTRLFYFTAQSNIWIGLTFLTILIVTFFFPRARRFKDKLYFFKFAFTSSITITALVFFCFLAPFADASYHVWSLSSFMTHLFAPVLAIVDFFVDDYPVYLTKKQRFCAVVPPTIWITIVSIMSILKVDFGRGVFYPYPFFNFYSQLGIFGFSKELPLMGAFYWIIGIGFMFFITGIIYAKLKAVQRRK